MPSFALTAIDLWTIGLYLVGILGFGLWMGRGAETPQDYFLAGRSLSWPVVGFSLFATNISSATLIGLAGDAYGTGIAVYNYEWFAVVALLLFVVVFLPMYLRSGVYTMPEFLERRFDARSRYYFSGVTILSSILLETAGALYAGALVIRLIYPDIPLLASIAVLAVAAGLYTAVGGLKAVVYTDTIQAVLLLVGATTIAAVAAFRIGSWEAVTAAVDPGMLNLVKPADDPVLPWPALVTGLPILGIYYWCANQYIVQRALGARDLEHGRKGAILAGFLKIPVLFIMVFPGLFARVLYTDLPQPDLVFPILIFDMLPVGLRGLMVVALVAAIMSSLDSTLNAASTLVTMDFVKKLRPSTSDERLVVVGRVVTLSVMLLGALWAPQIHRFPSLWQYLQAILAYISPPIVACFLVGVFWRRATATGAITALLAGMSAAVLLIVVGTTIHFLYVAFLLFAFSVCVLVLTSLATPAPDPDAVEPFLWRRAYGLPSPGSIQGWTADYRYAAGAMLFVVLVVVAFFA